MQTDATLGLLDQLTKEFGKLMRDFRDVTCAEFNTVELPREAAARGRQQARNERHTNTQPPNSGSRPGAEKRAKKLNLFTSKFHALGDYVRAIRLFGPTDNYSTQLVRAS